MPNPNDSPQDLDALDAAFDAELSKAGVTEKETPAAEAPPEKSTEEALEDLDNALEGKDNADSTTPPADKSTEASKAPEDDVDAEILKALGDAEPAKSETETAQEVVFNTFSSVREQAEKNKWDSPELKQLLGYQDTIWKYAENLSRVEEKLEAEKETLSRRAAVLSAEFTELLAPLGLSEKVFAARNWPQLVHEAFKKTYTKTDAAAATSILDQVEDDDDIPLTKKEVKGLVKQYLATAPAPTTKSDAPNPVEERLARLEAEKEQAASAGVVNDRIVYWISKDPLLSALSKKSDEYKNRIVARIAREVGTNYTAALGKDKSGAPIKRIVDEYAAVTRESLSAMNPPKKKAEKGTPTPASGGRPSTGVAHQFKQIPTHKEVDGRKVKLTSDEAMDALDEEFDKVLGLQ